MYAGGQASKRLSITSHWERRMEFPKLSCSYKTSKAYLSCSPARYNEPKETAVNTHVRVLSSCRFTDENRIGLRNSFVDSLLEIFYTVCCQLPLSMRFTLCTSSSSFSSYFSSSSFFFFFFSVFSFFFFLASNLDSGEGR